jgi:DDE family transposase
MIQILLKLKKLNSHLKFTKTAFTKNGFRHITNYINGLIAINRKSIKSISKNSPDEINHNSIQKLLQNGKFDQNALEKRYIKKLKFIFKNLKISLIFDDTLHQRFGKKIQGSQSHKNHASGSNYIYGHQYFTAMLIAGKLQFPLFPRLYDKDSITKIEMAYELIQNVSQHIKIKNVLCDSWYSDVKIMKLCRRKHIRIICGIKTNRKIKFKYKQKYKKLSKFSNENPPKKNFFIDDKEYRIQSYSLHLNKFPKVKMLISQEYLNEKWSDHFHLISSKQNDSIVKIIRTYNLRWAIETFHRDIKQNLGFNKCFLRKKTSIVRHSILVSVAYIILKLFMLQNGMQMTIGECIEYITNREFNEFMQKIIEIEDKDERIGKYMRLFKKEIAQV